MTAPDFADSRASWTPITGLRFEFLRYFCTSALALAVDVGAFSLGMRVGMTYQFAAAMGFIGGLALAYWLSVHFVFEARSLDSPAVEFGVFAGIGVMGLLLTEVILWACVSKLGRSPMFAKLASTAIVFLFNFASRKALLFRAHRV